MQKKNLVLFALVALLLVTGCDLFQKDPVWFPTTTGSTWRFEGEMTFEQLDADTFWSQVGHSVVTGTAELGVGGTASVFVYTDSTRQRLPFDTTIVKTDTTWVLSNSNWVLAFDGTGDTEPDTVLALPLEQDKTWQVHASGDTAVWATVVGREDITVPAGTYKDCWEVKLETTVSGLGAFVTFWYADGIGRVRNWSRTSQGGFTATVENRLTDVDVK